jgi:hypothetical protein
MMEGYKIGKGMDSLQLQASYLEQIEAVLPFICTPEELLGEANYE